MREILFRGKRVDNGEWAESQYPYGTMSGGVVQHDFIPKTVGQFTGLTDKNGVKIFEGDIVNYFGKDFLNHLVTFDKGSFWFEFLSKYTRKIRDQKRDLIFSNVSMCGEVIGNIYDNPELIGDMDIKLAAKMSDAPAEQLGLAPAT